MDNIQFQNAGSEGTLGLHAMCSPLERCLGTSPQYVQERFLSNPGLGVRWNSIVVPSLGCYALVAAEVVLNSPVSAALLQLKVTSWI